MDAQLIIVYIIIALAVIAVVRSLWRRNNSCSECQTRRRTDGTMHNNPKCDCCEGCNKERTDCNSKCNIPQSR